MTLLVHVWFSLFDGTNKNHENLYSMIKNQFTVSGKKPLCPIVYFQEIGYTHMRIAEGVNSLLQMAAMLARLCKKSGTPSALGWIYTVLHVSTKDSFLWMSEVQIFPILMDKYCLWLRCLITL